MANSCISGLILHQNWQHNVCNMLVLYIIFPLGKKEDFQFEIELCSSVAILQKRLVGISSYTSYQHQVWHGDYNACLFNILILSLIINISDILSGQISLSFNMTMFAVATLFSNKICHSINIEQVAATIYYWYS